MLVDASLRAPAIPTSTQSADSRRWKHSGAGYQVSVLNTGPTLKPAVAAAGMLGRPGEYAEPVFYLFTVITTPAWSTLGHAPRADRVATLPAASSSPFPGLRTATAGCWGR